MKFNKWTLGLAAVGAVSLVSAARAEEKTASPMVMTGVASTTLSGYVDTSIHWNPGTGNANVPAYSFNQTPAGGPAKSDGFNLDAVLIRISKSLDESEWAAGYDVDLFAGPDAQDLATGLGNNLIKQAYVTVRTPVGKGIDWKLGVFDNWIGYESTEAPGNPNYTRSYGYSIEPTTFTGLTGTYKITDDLNVSAGLADTAVGAINARANPPKAESSKTWLGSVAYTAPSNWGSIAGSSFYAGFINGWNAANGPAVQANYFVGATINTPVTGLKTGVAYDHVHRQAQGYTVPPGPAAVADAWADDFALYASYALPNTKWSFHSRAEYFEQNNTAVAPILGGGTPSQVFAFTETIQYRPLGERAQPAGTPLGPPGRQPDGQPRQP